VKGCRCFVDRCSEAPQCFGARFARREPQGHQIIDAFGEERAKLFVRVRAGLCARANRESEEAAKLHGHSDLRGSRGEHRGERVELVEQRR